MTNNKLCFFLPRYTQQIYEALRKMFRVARCWRSGKLKTCITFRWKSKNKFRFDEHEAAVKLALFASTKQQQFQLALSGRVIVCLRALDEVLIVLYRE